MLGLVNQLQADALDSSVSLTTLLRKVKVAAVKLGLTDTLEWVDAELDGYTKKVPDYREVHGKLKWFNPMRGYLPVAFQDNRTANEYEMWPVPESVASLESNLASDNATFVLQMPAPVTNLLSQSVGFRVTSAILEVPRGALVSIIEHVRNLVLNWALELERAGVTGDGLSFSVQEQKMAKSAHISIGTFQGTFNTGDLSGTNSRISQNSTDDSTNISADLSVFGAVEAAIKDGIQNVETRDLLLDDLERLKSSPEGSSRVKAYRQFISDAANHITVLGPFIPGLTAFLG